MKRAIKYLVPLLAILALAWYVMRPPGPEIVARRFIEAAAASDWDTMLSLTPGMEREAHKWDEAKFRTFASALMANAPRDFRTFTIKELSWGSDDSEAYEVVSRDGPNVISRKLQEWNPEQERHFDVVFGGPQDAARMRLKVHRDTDGHWYAPGMSFLMFANKSTSDDPRIRVANLVNAMNSAELNTLYSLESQSKLTKERLTAYVEGRIDFAEVLERW